MSWERRKREAARPMNQRKVHLRRKVWLDGEGRIPGLVAGVGATRAFLTPAAALELADRLVDMAEAVEQEHGTVAGASESLQASTSATDAA